jgi:hypothetical protein
MPTGSECPAAKFEVTEAAETWQSLNENLEFFAECSSHLEERKFRTLSNFLSSTEIGFSPSVCA